LSVITSSVLILIGYSSNPLSECGQKHSLCWCQRMQLFLLPVNTLTGLYRFNKKSYLMKRNIIAIQEAMAKLNEARMQLRQ
jgi:hypothetical protein